MRSRLPELRIRLLATVYGMEEQLTIADLRGLQQGGKLDTVVLSFSVQGNQDSREERQVIFGKCPGLQQMSPWNWEGHSTRSNSCISVVGVISPGCCSTEPAEEPPDLFSRSWIIRSSGGSFIGETIKESSSKLQAQWQVFSWVMAMSDQKKLIPCGALSPNCNSSRNFTFV